MKWTFLMIGILSSLAIHAQSVEVKEIRFRPNPKYYNTKDSTIIYPIIVTGNRTASQMINKNIEVTVLEFDPDVKSKTTRDELRNMIRMGLTDMSYIVTYNKNGILSLEIDLEIEAAYPNPSEYYFNFDVRTGQLLEIKDILKDSLIGQFQSKVFSDKIDSLKKYKEQDLKILLSKKEIDTTVYRWATEEVDSNCINSIDISNYSLSKSGLAIFDQCEFPHAIRGVAPDYQLRYSYQFMYPYLKPEFQARLVKHNLNIHQ